MKHILDPSFRYVPAAETDIRLTFARERARLAEIKQAVPVQQLPAADLHPKLPGWQRAMAADEKADLERAQQQTGDQR